MLCGGCGCSSAGSHTKKSICEAAREDELRFPAILCAESFPPMFDCVERH